MFATLTGFLHSSTFHGLLFLGADERHPSERLFWLLCCLLSWIGSALLMAASWDDFRHNAISFVVDTSHLEWDTKFPSIAVCEADNQQKIAELTDRLYGDPHDYNLDEMIKELVYFRGQTHYMQQLCNLDQPMNPHCPTGNFTYFSPLVRNSCKETFSQCKWNNRTFDCCDYFSSMETELGLCFAINSAQAKSPRKRLNMASDRKSGPSSLYIEIRSIANIYVLGELEVPSLTTLQTDIMQVTPHIHYHRFFALKEIENEEEVHTVDIDQRNCRHRKEHHLTVHPFYSYSACCVQCRMAAQLRMCNCTHHLVPGAHAAHHCGLAGMACLNKQYNELAVLKTSWARRNGLVCDCMPSCSEVELFLIKDDKYGIKEAFAVVEFTLERLPTERFKRTVVRGRLDLVVSMGGTAALFMGASLLSFVEFIYHFTIRSYNNFRTKPKKQPFLS